MTKFFSAIAGITLLVSSGCNTGSESGGRPVPANDATPAPPPLPEKTLVSDSNATVDRVRKIVSEQMNVPIEKVTSTMTLRSLGADDLDYVELVMELEDSFSITIPDEIAVDIKGVHKWPKFTIQELSDLVDRRRELKPSAPADPGARPGGS